MYMSAKFIPNGFLDFEKIQNLGKITKLTNLMSADYEKISEFYQKLMEPKAIHQSY